MPVVTSGTPSTSTSDRAPADLRPTGLAGLGSVVAMAVAFAVLPADAGGSAPDDVARRYADGSGGYLRAAVLESLSVALLGVFVAGLCVFLWRRHGGAVPVVAALGGTVLATCQLLGYAVIATLAYGTAGGGGTAVVTALYDLSAVLFVVANVGLVLLCASAGYDLLRGPGRYPVLGSASLLLAGAAAVASAAYAPDGPLSVHGDVGFVVGLLQLAWVLAVSVRLLVLRPPTSGRG